tara:strand:+ start:10402 stop:11202 length:801 start_codon:yes stop_codon:yes gene_type:complete
MLIKLWNYVKSKRFLLNLAAMIVAYFIIIFGFKAYLGSRTNHGQKIEVPNFVGENQNNLKNVLTGSQLSVEILDSIYDPTKVEGTILEQDPMPTSLSKIYVKEGRVVRVRVSKRTQLIEMPDLVDKSQRFAENILNNRKIRYKLEYQPSKEAHGAVIDQQYKGKFILPTTKLPIGSRITLIVGRDESGVSLVLPNLFGLTIVEARERIGNMSSMDFMAVCPSCITQADSLMARVISQSPEFSEGAVVASGTTISVYAEKEFSGETP